MQSFYNKINIMVVAVVDAVAVYIYIVAVYVW